MKPHEIAYQIHLEMIKLVPSQSKLNEMIEELCDLVGADFAKELIARAARALPQGYE
jgi:hypothetical protein